MTSEFDNQITQWVQIDDRLKQLNEQVKVLREQRNVLETNITTYASLNNLSNYKDKLKFTQSRVQESITFKYLERTLSEIIKNEDQINMIMEHIKKKREIKIVPEIKRIS